MAKGLIKTALVIGEDDKTIVSRYDASEHKGKHVITDVTHLGEVREQICKTIHDLLNNRYIPTSQDEVERLSRLYCAAHELDDKDFMTHLSSSLTLIDGMLQTYENPEGRYLYPSEHYNRYHAKGDEYPLATPLTLKDGTKDYRMRLCDIDWDAMTLPPKKVALYKAAWDTVIEGAVPGNKQEEAIYESMKNRVHYFLEFNDRDDYIQQSCRPWFDYIITEDTIIERTPFISRKRWAIEFLERMEEAVEGFRDSDLTATVYEMRSLKS